MEGYKKKEVEAEDGKLSLKRVKRTVCSFFLW